MTKRPVTIFDEDADINLLNLLDEQINLSPIADIDLEEQIKLLAEGDADLSDYIDDDLRDAFIKRRR